jgi:hypothetical protein
MNMTEQTTIPATGPLVLELPPPLEATVAPEDPIEEVEKKIRQATIDYTTATVGSVQEILMGDLPPSSQARALHLLEGIANVQAQMLRLLGGEKKRRRRKFIGGGYLSMGSGSTIDSALGYNDDEEPESFTGDPSGETFGNKALQQMIAMIKPVLQQGGLLGMASNTKANQKGAEIESLTKALAEANKSKLSPEIRDSIMAKLKAALAADQPAAPALLTSATETTP